MATGIYVIENIVNHKFYIGQSININQRFHGHLSCLRRNCHNNLYLQRSWNKYKEENFKFYIIEECNQNDLNKKETKWCEYYKEVFGKENVYNLGHTGEVGTMSKEQRLKISNAKKEFYKNHPEALEQMSIARSGNKNAMHGVCGKRHPMYGKHHTEEVRQKLRMLRLGTKQSEETKRLKSLKESGKNNPMYGKHHTEEARQKISLHHKGKALNPEQRKKLSEVLSGSIWINNGNESKMIKPVFWEEFSKNGWKKGRIKLSRKEITNGK